MTSRQSPAVRPHSGQPVAWWALVGWGWVTRPWPGWWQRAYGLGDEAWQGLQGGTQGVQATLQGGQACLQLLLLDLQLGHHFTRDALCLQRWTGPVTKGGAKGWLKTEA